MTKNQEPPRQKKEHLDKRAQALRDNLMKRKKQTRARVSEEKKEKQ